jgi:hypothetical protein
MIMAVLLGRPAPVIMNRGDGESLGRGDGGSLALRYRIIRDHDLDVVTAALIDRERLTGRWQVMLTLGERFRGCGAGGDYVLVRRLWHNGMVIIVPWSATPSLAR